LSRAHLARTRAEGLGEAATAETRTEAARRALRGTTLRTLPEGALATPEPPLPAAALAGLSREGLGEAALPEAALAAPEPALPARAGRTLTRTRALSGALSSAGRLGEAALAEPASGEATGRPLSKATSTPEPPLPAAVLAGLSREGLGETALPEAALAPPEPALPARAGRTLTRARALPGADRLGEAALAEPASGEATGRGLSKAAEARLRFGRLPRRNDLRDGFFLSRTGIGGWGFGLVRVGWLLGLVHYRAPIYPGITGRNAPSLLHDRQ
jgi:hypothetical protein